MQKRPSGRLYSQSREIEITTNVSKNAQGSCLIKYGDTHVLCTATIDDRVPRYVKGTNKGWITAEYGMLPGSGSTRVEREASRGKQSGRTMEIQRLIARSLRAAVDLKSFGEYQAIIDCDVLQADGGTRTASITGGYIALHLAIKYSYARGIIRKIPKLSQVAAISCGVYKGQVVVDLDYIEDSNAEADANFVLNQAGEIIEIQATAETKAFNEQQLIEMLSYAKETCQKLFILQKQAIG